MKLLDMIKEQLNWKDLSEAEAQQVIDELDSQIEEIRKRDEQEQRDSKQAEEKAREKELERLELNNIPGTMPGRSSDMGKAFHR